MPQEHLPIEDGIVEYVASTCENEEGVVRSEPGVVVRFDDQSTTIPVGPESTFEQIKAAGIRALGLHAVEPDVYRLVVNGEIIGNEQERVSDLGAAVRVTLIKQPTLGRKRRRHDHGSRTE